MTSPALPAPPKAPYPNWIEWLNSCAAVARRASSGVPGNGPKLRFSTMQLATASRSFQGVEGLLPATRVPAT